MGEGFDLRTGVRFLNIICGFTLFGLAIWSFITLSIDPFVVVTNLYWILFGSLIICVEFKIDFMVRYFRFMEGTVGKGLFLIFVGMWVIQGTLITDILGGVLVGCGVATTILLGVAGS